ACLSASAVSSCRRPKPCTNPDSRAAIKAKPIPLLSRLLIGQTRVPPCFGKGRENRWNHSDRYGESLDCKRGIQRTRTPGGNSRLFVAPESRQRRRNKGLGNAKGGIRLGRASRRIASLRVAASVEMRH